MSVASRLSTRASKIPVTQLVFVARGVFPRSTPCVCALRGFLPERVLPDRTTRRHGLAHLPPDWVGLAGRVVTRSAFADLTPERLCSADPSARPLLEAVLELLRRIDERAAPRWLQWLGGPRGVFRCAKTMDDEGILDLSEGLGDPRLPYGRDVNAGLRIRPLDRDLADAESARADLVVAPEPPSAPAASASAPVVLRSPMWGGLSGPAYVPEGPADMGAPVVLTPLGVAV